MDIPDIIYYLTKEGISFENVKFKARNEYSYELTLEEYRKIKRGELL